MSLPHRIIMEKQEAKQRITYSIQYILSSDIERTVNGEARIRKRSNSSSEEESPETDVSFDQDEHVKTKASKRFRTIFTDDQLQKLEARFQQTKYPDPIERHDIAVALDLSETKVKVWFQNRRMKMKRNYWKARNNYMSQTYFPTTIAVPCSLPCPTNIPESYCEGQECSYCPMLLMPAQYQRPVAYNPASDPHQQRPRAYSPSSDHPQHHPLGYSYSRNQSPTYPSDNEMQERHTFSSPPTAYSYPQSNFNAPISRTANISDSKTNVFGWTRGREDLSMNGYGHLRGQKTSSSQAGSCKLRPIVIK